MGQVGSAAAKPHLEAKTIRPIAISGTGGKRLSWLPNVPTFEELGYPQVNAVFWVGLSGPPGMPKPIVDTWNEAVRKLVLEDKEFKADLDKVGLEPKWRNQQEVIQYMKDQLDLNRVLWGATK
jgi:tripartite-type tricarboxylate transporter receptor subunit TctC